MQWASNTLSTIWISGVSRIEGYYLVRFWTPWLIYFLSLYMNHHLWGSPIVNVFFLRKMILALPLTPPPPHYPETLCPGQGQRNGAVHGQISITFKDISGRSGYTHWVVNSFTSLLMAEITKIWFLKDTSPLRTKPHVSGMSFPR